MSILKTVGKATLITMIALIVVGFSYQSYSSYRDSQNFPPTGRMVDLGGYSLHAQIVGNGRTTVVLDAGMGAVGLAWDNVTLEIDSIATVFSYDRGGLGWSERSPLPRTSENMVAELHQLLDRTGMSPPYILVGHSHGGLNMQLFAKIYPDEVAGLILVDSAHPNMTERLPTPPLLRRTLFRFGMWAAPIGIPRAYLSNKGSAVHALRSTTKHQHTYLDELAMAGESAAALNRLADSFGDLLLVVIARNHASDSIELRDASERMIAWAQLQEDFARQSSKSTLIFSKHPQHSIHKYQPELVIDSIKAMVTDVDREHSVAEAE